MLGAVQERMSPLRKQRRLQDLAVVRLEEEFQRQVVGVVVVVAVVLAPPSDASDPGVVARRASFRVGRLLRVVLAARMSAWPQVIVHQLGDDHLLKGGVV